MEAVLVVVLLALPFVILGAVLAILIVVIGNQTGPTKK